uniref:Uncharacterized protein n=1 Tax=Rhizophora mucronata TaxID=61149 RepID=A0A2P2QEZ4_RHIMU
MQDVYSHSLYSKKRLFVSCDLCLFPIADKYSKHLIFSIFQNK